MHGKEVKSLKIQNQNAQRTERAQRREQWKSRMENIARAERMSEKVHSPDQGMPHSEGDGHKGKNISPGN